MFKPASQEIPLPEKRLRHVFSMRIATVLAVFFGASTFLLEWALATEQFFMRDGLTRQFVQLEATICAVIAVCAMLHLLAKAAVWGLTVVRMRRLEAVRKPLRSPMKPAVPRAGALG